MDTVLTLDHFSKIYPNGRGARNITFSVERGQVVGLLGPNGSGKTTIMKSITGLAQPSEGTITVFGANVAHREQALAKVGSSLNSRRCMNISRPRTTCAWPPGTTGT